MSTNDGEALDVSLSPTAKYLRRRALKCGVVASVIFLLILLIIATRPSFGDLRIARPLILGLMLVQTGLGVAAAVYSLRYRRLSHSPWWMGNTVLFGLVGMLWPLFVLLAFLQSIGHKSHGSIGGRPLRLRRRILHPSLRIGSDWSQGAQPSPVGLDTPTRRALEALWLHDAQREHASVPAFTRLSWFLAAVGAPADLLESVHHAALDEIDHARRCFALAAGYGSRSHSVEPMPELLVGGLELKGDPWEYIAVESLKDGCLLEGFNADVAELCAQECKEPAARDVLERIARDERAHAELAWRVLALCAERGGERVRASLGRALRQLEGIPRPTAVSHEQQALCDAADVRVLRDHGRLPDSEWKKLWPPCCARTTARAQALLEDHAALAAHARASTVAAA